MLVELWGASDAFRLTLPGSPLGYILLFIETILIGTVLFVVTKIPPVRHPQRWQWTLALSLAGFITSQLFPIFFPFTSQPLTPFSVLPLLLAATILDPFAVIIVGAMTGLGQGLGQTHQLFDIYHFAITGLVAYVFMRQRYIGRLYNLCRHPVVSGLLSMIGPAVLLGIATFANAADGNSLTALDQALYQGNNALFLFLIEGLIGGTLLFIILQALPNLRPRQTHIPSPARRSLRKQLLGNFFAFSLFLTLLLVTVVFNLSINVSRRLVLNQMAHNAGIASADIPAFQTELEKLIEAFEDASLFLPGDPDTSTDGLEQIYKSSLLYRRLMIVGKDQAITAHWPPADNDTLALTPAELAAINDVFTTNITDIVTMDVDKPGEPLSFMVPVPDDNGEPQAVIIGRVTQLSINNLIVGMQGVAAESVGFIVNDESLIIAHPDETKLRTEWKPEENGRSLSVPVSDGQSGAYQTVEPETGTRQLVYYLQDTAHDWSVVISVPYAVVLDLSLDIGLPLFAILMIVSIASFVQLAVQSRGITDPITEIVNASKTMAAGGNWTPAIHAQRDDEIGQLSQAFSQMQRSMKKRLNELSLLLSVSHDVSTNIDLNQGMPAILRGALRGTGASGARAVVLNPSGGNPLTFSEGPASRNMAALDRRIMSKLRYTSELMLATPAEIRAALELDQSREVPIPALLAIPLHSHKRFQGVLWLGYRQANSFDLSERNLLHTLASQAAVLVGNAHLFATAEGGRRRLAAVLASTSDAVIVTDPTKRVLLINPAMEHLFGLKAGDVANRPVASVISAKPLVEALTTENDYTHNLEIPVTDGRIFYASVSRITSRAGQVFGRVAVLRDITHLKEIDEMKSDFVSTVSHDLRNPLTFMRGYITMLPMVGEVNEKQYEYVDKILTGIDQMTKMVDDLLDLSRIEAGIDFQQDEIEIKPLLSDIADEYWQHAHLAGIKIHVDVQPEVVSVRGDRALIRQAITNLVGNGIKYAPKSGRLWLRAMQHNSKVIISVEDNGPGIPEEAQIRLFEKFYRVKQPGTEKVKGTGLGLAIVKTIAERHGGSARCYSKVGEGATFFIELPHNSGFSNGMSANGQGNRD